MTTDLDTRITDLDTARTVLGALHELEAEDTGFYLRGGVEIDGKIWMACGRCAGRGHMGGGIGPYAWQTCFECRGSKGRHVDLMTHARRERSRYRTWAKKAAEKAEREATREERMLEGQRNWCEKNGYGRITFAERDALRAEEKAEKAAQLSYVGDVGERRSFGLTYVRSFGFATRYGWLNIHKFEDADGNLLVWKTGNDLVADGVELDEGTRVTLKATVKAHDTYRGEKQTVLTRATILDAEVAKAA